MIEKMLTIEIKNKTQMIHWHDVLEIDLVLSGEIEAVRNNKTITVKEGEIIVFNRDDVHSIGSASENLLYVQIQMNLEYYNQYIPDIWTVLFHCSPENTDDVSRNLMGEIKSYISLISELIEKGAGDVDAEKKIIYYCIEILANLKMGFAATLNADRTPMNEEQAANSWKMIDYMYDHHNRKLTLHEVAQQIYVSDDYASRLLKRQHGKSFEEFLAFIRAEISIRFLLNTDMSISTIASECGFSAPRYYNAAFTRAYGCSPVEYRKKNKENFALEKQKTAAKILYDEGVSREETRRRLQKYKIYYDDGQVQRKKITIDLNSAGELPAKKPEAALFARKGRSVWAYEVQQVISEIPLHASQPEHGIFFWKENDAWKILIIQAENSDITEYSLRIQGLEKNGEYIYFREKTPDLPESVRKLFLQGRASLLHRDILRSFSQKTTEFGEIRSEEYLYMDITLSAEQIARIIVQKL